MRQMDDFTHCSVILVLWRLENDVNTAKAKTQVILFLKVLGVRKPKAQGDINWKQLFLKRQLFQVIFWHGHHQFKCFFASLYLQQEGCVEVFFSDDGGDPLQGALGHQAACQIWIQEKKKRSLMQIGRLGGHLDAFRRRQLLKIKVAMAF